MPNPRAITLSRAWLVPLEAPSEFELDLFVPPHPYAATAFVATTAHPATMTALLGMAPGATSATLAAFAATLTPLASGMAAGAATASLTASGATLSAQPAGMVPNVTAAALTSYGAVLGAVPVSMGPGSAAATLSAFSATLTPAAAGLTAGTATASLVAYAATLTETGVFSPGSASTSLTAFGATLVPGAVTLSAGAAAVSLTAFAATLVPGAVTLTAGTATASLAAFGATLVPGSVPMLAGTATITLTAYAATLTATGGPDTFTPDAATATLTAFSATLAPQAALFTAGTATITLTAFSATLAATALVASPGSATITLTAFAATLTATALVASPGTTTATLTAFAATLTPVAALMTAGTATITLNAFSATLSAAGGFFPGSATAALTAYAATVTLQPAPFSGDRPEKKDMIAFWRFEEASGTRADAHGAFASLGLIVDTGDGDPPNATGKHGNAVHFDPTAPADQLTVKAANAGPLDIGAGDLTVILWLNLDAVPTAGNYFGIVEKGATSGGVEGYLVSLREQTGGYRVRFEVSNGTVVRAAQIGANMSAGSWYCVVARYDNSDTTAGIKIAAYDSSGSLVSSATAAAYNEDLSNAGRDFRVQSSYVENLDGLVDSLAVWSRFLPDAQVTNIVNGGAGWDYSDYTTNALDTASIALAAYGATMVAGGPASFAPGTTTASLTAYAATMAAFVPKVYYPRATLNNETTCDAGSGVDRDLSQTQGTPSTQAIAINSDTFGIVATYDINVVAQNPKTGTHTVQVSINAIDANAELRWRLRAIDDTGCAVDNNSAYSAVYTTTGNKSDSLSLTWAGTSDRLRLSVELRRTSGHGTVNATLDVNSTNTKITAPW